MIKLFIFSLCVCSSLAYFTLPGKCPEHVKGQENFRVPDFYEKWYQVYHYSSDEQSLSNCSTIEFKTTPTGINLNISRIDREIFHRYSIGKVEIPTKVEKAAKLNVAYHFDNAPKRLKKRKYPFTVLATNYNYFATVYTCSYSSIIDKHFIYVWILSRSPTLNVVSKELADKPLSRIGVDSTKLVKDDNSKCSPKYYEDVATEPRTFRHSIQM